MTSNEKRLLTVTGTVVAVVAVAVLLLVPYIRQWQSYDNAIAQRQQQIQRLKRQVVNKPVLISEINRMDALMNASNLFIRAGDKATASGILLSSLKKLVEDAGGEIRSVTSLSPKKQQAADDNIVAAKMDFTIDNMGFVDILSDLSTAKPVLNITAVRLTPLLKRKSRRTPKTDTGKLRLNMVVEASFITGGQP